MHCGMQVVAVAALVGVPQASLAASEDSRLAALERFFHRQHLPLERSVAEHFVAVADRYDLDWRLLPSLALIETGGRTGKNRNIMGWQSGRARFQSVEAGIEFVGRQLSRMPIYAGKHPRAILMAYNPLHPAYPDRVLAMMASLSLHLETRKEPN